MEYEQDYVMRMIKDMVRALALVIFGKKDIRYELPEDNERTDMDNLYARLLHMADEGKINEAENILLMDIPAETPYYSVMAIDFYQHISEFSDDFLNENNYSREEILEGLEKFAEDYGLLEKDICVEK